MLRGLPKHILEKTLFSKKRVWKYGRLTVNIMQMLKHNLQKWFLSFVKVWQPQSVLRCYLYRQCTGDLWQENVEWAYCSQCLPWSLLADWERAEVPSPLYNNLLWLNPLYKWSHLSHMTPWGCRCLVCIDKDLIRAIFWHPIFSNWVTHFDVIPNASLAAYSYITEWYSVSADWRHSATDSGYPTEAGAGLGSISISSSPRL
jgi:hypothetical protein